MKKDGKKGQEDHYDEKNLNFQRDWYLSMTTKIKQKQAIFVGKKLIFELIEKSPIKSWLKKFDKVFMINFFSVFFLQSMEINKFYFSFFD